MAWLPRSLLGSLLGNEVRDGRLRNMDDTLKVPWLRIVLYARREPQSEEAYAILRHFAGMRESPLAH
jgi:hypothetical protein